MQLPDILLSQKRLAEFIYVDRSTVTKHLKNIFNEGELSGENGGAA